MRVSFLPPTDEFEGNALFEGRRAGRSAHSPNVHWFDCYVALDRLARDAGIYMYTADLLPASEADVLVFMSQPSPAQSAAIRAQYPHLKMVLILLETSLGAAYCFNPRNHQSFDAVLTYKSELIDYKKYFPLKAHAYFPDRRRRGRAYGDRRTACLVGTNRKMHHRSGLMLARLGWRLSLSDRLDYMFCPGELITYRTKVGRSCVRHPAGDFDVIGEGWDIDPATRGKAAVPPAVSTLDYIGEYKFYFAFENHRAPDSLISERIWDALWGGAVPVYMGNPNIRECVPKECFVDAGSFCNADAMIDHIYAMPQECWESYIAAADEFLSGEKIRPFLPDACGQELLKPFLMLRDRQLA